MLLRAVRYPVANVSAAQAKYVVEIIPDDRSRYEFAIRTTGDNAQDIFVKETTGDHEQVLDALPRRFV